jgi:hypothetical protein
MDSKTSRLFTLYTKIGLVVIIFILNLFSLSLVSLLVILASKWRALAVQPNHWLTNLRASVVDTAVGFSVVALMASSTTTSSMFFDLVIAAMYLLWLIVAKPKNTKFWIVFQSIFAQFLSLIVLFTLLDNGLSGVVVVFLSWLVAYSCASHFMQNFDSDPSNTIISSVWGLIVAAFAWIAWWWNILYPIGGLMVLPQISIVVSILAYFSGSIIDADKRNKLDSGFWFRHIVPSIGLLIVIFMLTNWSETIR